MHPGIPRHYKTDPVHSCAQCRAARQIPFSMPSAHCACADQTLAQSSFRGNNLNGFSLFAVSLAGRTGASCRALLCLSLLPLVAVTTAPVHAHTFCVGTAPELTSALVTAASTYQNEDNAIQVKHGTYTGVWTYSVSNTHGITVSGGYYDFFGGCVADSLPDPTLTVLDGGDANTVLRITLLPGTSGSVTVTTLSFAHGKETFNGYGGGLIVLASGANGGDVLIDRNVFHHNTNTAAIGSSAGLAVSTGGVITVRNNLFANNTANVSSAMNLYNSAGHAYVTNNTVAYNVLTAAPVGNASVIYSGAGAAYAVFVNNIIVFVNSDVGDDIALNGRMTLIDNDFGASNGAPDGASIGNVAVDPKFVDGANGNFRLKPGSSLINVGDDTTSSLLGGISAYDLDGDTRTVGTAIDLGAYESDVLFANGFGP
jgi:hypothetical protein